MWGLGHIWNLHRLEKLTMLMFSGLKFSFEFRKELILAQAIKKF